jgi:hypothetical protein
METVLFFPQVAKASPMMPGVANDDSVFLNQGGILVTKTRFVAHGQTFALANISSVSKIVIPASKSGPLVAFALAGILMVIGEGLREASAAMACVTMMALGLLLLAAAVYALIKRRDTYAVVLGTAGGEVKTCLSPDAGFILRVVAALNEAIVSRG